MKQRLLYIDELKGFAILMVVIGHIFFFSFRIQGEEYISPWSEIIYSFHMPLFAFLSGLFIKPFTNLHLIRKTLERLCLPLIIIGGLYTLWRGRSLVDFALNDFKYGYWYFLFLFIAYLLVTFFDAICRMVNIKSHKLTSLFLIVIFCICISGGVKLLSPTIYNILGCNHITNYMPYIFLGFFIKQFSLFDKIFSNKLIFEGTAVLAFFAYITIHYLHHGTAVYLLSPCLVFVIVTAFYRMREKSSHIKETFQKWGKNSLEIYSLHYFFIHSCYLPYVYKFTMNNNLELVDIILATVLAVVICLLCVFIGDIIKMSKLFGYLCFGNKKNNL